MAITEPDASFDVILCSEMLEHLPDPLKILGEFLRLLKPSGKFVLAVPFAFLVHSAPYHYVSGLSHYWYEYHLPRRDFIVQACTPNGDWFACLKQEIFRLPSMVRRHGGWHWPVAYLVAGVAFIYFLLRFTSRLVVDVAH